MVLLWGSSACSLPPPPEVRSRLHLTVSPGAARSELLRSPEGELRVRVAAPAREGKANKELLRFLAARLGLSPSRVRLVRGEGSRHKVVEVEGLTATELNERLP